ncbi:MAG: S41 family peptidase [Bacteroidota bacterium]
MQLLRITCFILLSSIHLSAQQKVTFIVNGISDSYNQQVGIRGDQAPLDWDKSIALEKEGDQYRVTLEFSEELAKIEFKFVLENDDKEVQWETTPNRLLVFQDEKTQTSTNTWNKEQLFDISKLGKITSTKLLQDYTLIEEMVLKVHPGTYRYNSKEKVQQSLDELRQYFSEDRTHQEAYLAMTKVTAALQCGHTMVGFYNQSPLINSIIHRQANKLPFAFTWVNGKMIITHDATPDGVLPVGSAITSINGMSAQEILEKISHLVPADGATDKTRVRMSEVAAYDFELYPFDVLFPLVFPIENRLLQIQVQALGEEVTSLIVKAQTLEERIQQLYQRYPDFPRKADDLWKLELLDNKVGLLSLNSFALYGYGSLELDYKAWLANTFQTIKDKNIKHLIIDIRENKGGNDEIRMELFTYFKPKNKAQISENRVGKTRYLKFPEHLKAHVQTWGDSPWYFDLKPDRQEKDSEQDVVYYIFEEDFQEPKLKPKKAVYTGELYLLTSSINQSLSFYLATDFKMKGLGKIIGQETGGNLRDINGGQILFLRLPGSGIEIDFPVMGGFTNGDVPNQGVRPDYEIARNQSDITLGIDTELQYTIDLILNRKN